MYWFQVIAALILGFIIGALDVCFWMARRIFGTIKWAQSEDGPYLFLDMDKRPEEMVGHKYVIFKADLQENPQNKQ